MKRLLLLAGALNACWWSSCEPPPDTWVPPDAGGEPVGGCRKPADCGEDRFKWTCTPAGACIPLCQSSVDCAFGEDCEDAVCRPPACGNDDECGIGQQCIGGACEAAPRASAVDSCQVLPAVALTKAGATRTFTVVARDATGKTLAYKGEVTWSVDEPGRGAVAAGVLTGGAEAGTVKVQAKVGTTDCTFASVENLAAPAAGRSRVIIADLITQKTVANVKLVINEDAAVDVATGVYEFDTPAAAFDVHAYPADADGRRYAWVSAYGTTSTDLLLYTRQSLPSARFEGDMTARSFDSLSDLRGTIHLALQGSSIAGNIFDIELATLLGELVETEFDLGSQTFEAPWPEGTVIGLGEQMFRGAGDKPFAIVSSAGVRTLWGLGGNAEFAAVTEALGPAIGGGDVDIGGIMTRLLPMVGRLQSGALTGVVAEAGETTTINGPDGVSTLKLDALMRLRVEASLPDLPTYLTSSPDGDAPITRSFDAAIVLGGAHYDAQGFVPLGLSAGVDVLPEGSPDGRIDPLEIGSSDSGKVALRMAPLHSGMETSRHVLVALATSLDNLLGDEESDPVEVLSGLVTYPGELSFNDGHPTEVSFPGGFLGVPDLPGFTNRTFSAGSRLTGATFQRLSIGDAEGGEWLVYFAPGADVHLTLPTPPEGLTDRLGTDDEAPPRARLHSVRLNDPALTYDEVLEFGSDNLDDLSSRLEAFSHIEIRPTSAIVSP